MAAEYECCVCHHPIVDAIAPPLGSAERMCRVCSFLDGMGFDQAAQERIREFVGQPTMPFGYGRARIEQRHAEEGRARGICVFNVPPEIPQEKGPAETGPSRRDLGLSQPPEPISLESGRS